MVSLLHVSAFFGHFQRKNKIVVIYVMPLLYISLLNTTPKMAEKGQNL